MCGPLHNTLCAMRLARSAHRARCGSPAPHIMSRSCAMRLARSAHNEVACGARGTKGTSGFVRDAARPRSAQSEVVCGAAWRGGGRVSVGCGPPAPPSAFSRRATRQVRSKTQDNHLVHVIVCAIPLARSAQTEVAGEILVGGGRGALKGGALD